MANFQQRHKNKKEKRRRAARAMAMAAKRAAEEKKTMVVLVTRDGAELVVPTADACRYGTKLEVDIKLQHRYENAYPQNPRSSEGYSLIHLAVRSDILSMVIHYTNQQVSGDPGWDPAKFVHGLDHAMLFDLVLAAENLQNQGLLDLTCRTIKDMIQGKSQTQIRAMFGIRPPQPKQGKIPKKLMTPDQKKQVDLEERALRALHTVRCQEFTAYDPKRQYFVLTRLFYLYNFAFFDHDKESEFCRGPPLHEIRPPTCNSIVCDSIVDSCVNFISLKVCESDVGFPINVFGTVIARDKVDYRCVYLFKREADDSQIITSPDDMLTLMDPSRALVPDDSVFLEFNLKIKCDGGAVKDFSRSVTEFNRCRVDENKTMTVGLTSWLSTVELLCADVWKPLEASISINILKGTCDITRVAAWTTANTVDRIILYDSEASAGNQMTKMGTSIMLARRVVAVPLDEKLVLNLVVDAYETDDLVLTLGHFDDQHIHVFKMDCCEFEVKVAWTAVPRKRKRCNKWEDIGNEHLLL